MQSYKLAITVLIDISLVCVLNLQKQVLTGAVSKSQNASDTIRYKIRYEIMFIHKQINDNIKQLFVSTVCQVLILF